MRGKSFISAAFLSCFLVLLIGTTGWMEKAASASYQGVSLRNREEIVRGIRDGLKRRSPGITVEFSGFAKDLGDVSDFSAELFKAALAETGDPREGDYIRFQLGGYEAKYQRTPDAGKSRHVLRIEPAYYTGAEEEAAVDAEAERLLSEFSFSGETTDYEKVCAVYAYLVSHVSYDRVHEGNPNHHLKTTAYSALLLHSAVCQGYAVSLYRLLREAGVGCRVITGTGIDPESGKEKYHAWNIVCIDGTWYNLDVTWGSVLGTDEYFLKSDASFPGHERASEYEALSFRQKYPMTEVDYEKISCNATGDCDSVCGTLYRQ